MHNVYLYSLLLLLFSACGSSDTEHSEGELSESLIDKRFQTCYYENNHARKQADSVLMSIFGTTLFRNTIELNPAESKMNCQVNETIQLLPFGDSSCCVPNSYELQYSVKDKNESIFTFRMVAGSDMQFEPVSTIVSDQLTGYRMLANGELNISFREAKRIALQNGVDLDESLLELVRNEEDSLTKQHTYHWEAELEYDHNSVSLLLIDAKSGITSREVFRLEQ